MELAVHKLPISFELSSTDYDTKLAFSVNHNKQTIFKTDHVNQPQQINLLLDHGDEDQTLSFRMSGKLQEHTVLDAQGNIVKDSAIITDKFLLDGYELKTMFNTNCKYYHDNNGNTDLETSTYDNYMGCNGVVVFQFSSPGYIWILKNW